MDSANKPKPLNLKFNVLFAIAIVPVAQLTFIQRAWFTLTGSSIIGKDSTKLEFYYGSDLTLRQHNVVILKKLLNLEAIMQF